MANKVQSKDEGMAANSAKKVCSKQITANNEFTFYEGQEDDEQMSIDS